jgi:hypothetical protein
MPATDSTRDHDQVLHRLLLGDPAAIVAAPASDDPAVLVAASLVADDGDALLARAERLAATTRDRQLVAIAHAHRAGARDLVDALARDHHVDHPGSVLVAWIASASHQRPPVTDEPDTDPTTDYRTDKEQS